jgi:tetratricopeptide (TPR) repeat protein
MNHNLDLYRLEGFTGRRAQLLQLHEWLTGGDDLPAIAISGEQGSGRSALATAAAWNHIHDFSDGVIRVSPAGAAPFRLYDVVRTMDVVFGTTLTRASQERWGVSILEQLYRRSRLIILDKLAGATERELHTLVEIVSHLHENTGNSRLILIEREFQPEIAELVQFQRIDLGGIREDELPEFVRRRAPQSVQTAALNNRDELHALSGGQPLCLRLILGMMLDLAWEELSSLLQDMRTPRGAADVHQVTAIAIETLAIAQPQVGPFLERLVTARGGASVQAIQDLFWGDLGDADEMRRVLDDLAGRSVIEFDSYRKRVVLHPVIRRYLEQNAAMLGEEWERRHARFYVDFASSYSTEPLEKWVEIDAEWGNIFKGADWCQQRVERIWQRKPFDMVSEATVDHLPLPLPAEILHEQLAVKEDLRVVRGYASSLAHYAFWRHPPGIHAWLAAGAVAALALADYREFGWFLLNIGRQFFFMGEIERSIGWFERARDIFDPRDLLSELAYAYTDLGTALRLLDQPRKALDYFNAAFDCVAQLGDQYGVATAYMNLGSALYTVGNYERAFIEHRKALRMAVRRSDPRLIGSAYNNMGLVLEAIERLADARRAYEYALYQFQRIDDLVGVSACYNNLGSACYATQDYEQALHWYELDMELLERRGAWTDMAATLHNLGHVALEMETLDKALAYFTQSRDLYAAFELTEYVAEEQEMIDFIAAQTKR